MPRKVRNDDHLTILNPPLHTSVLARPTVTSTLVVPPGTSKRIPLVVQVPEQQHVIYEEPCMVYLVVHVWELTTVSSDISRLRRRLSASSSIAVQGGGRGDLELLAWERLERPGAGLCLCVCV